MSLVSPTQVSDGTTADASDINTPVNQLAAVINGNIDDNNINTTANIQGSKIATSTITNTQMSTEVKPVTRTSEGSFDFVASGCVWTGDAYASTLLASMTAGVVYINGRRINIAAVTAHAFTASKDTYVDILDNADGTGTVVYTEATNNAASSALAANSLRIAIIVTGAGNIAAATSINQGQRTRVLPIASSVPYQVTDSLGNLICPRDPNRRIIGYRQRITSQSATTEVQITELAVPVKIPAYRTAKVTIWSSRLSNDTAGNGAKMGVWDGTVGSGTLIAAASFDGAAVNNAGVPVCQSGFYTNATASTESKTFNGSIGANGSGNGTLLFTGFTNLYAWLLVELV